MNERQVRMGEIFGYAFKNDALLEEALTTPSYRMTCPKAKDNQRLEFLGDAVLDFLAADQLFASCPGDSEGPLTVKRTHMVSSPALCAAAVRHGLGARLRRNKGAAPLPDNAKTYADAVEAILGAAWLDGGLAAARQVGYDPYAANAASYDITANPLVMITFIALIVFTIVVSVINSIRTSHAFNHGAGFAVGLFFLQPIFWLILGFGSSKYNKKKALAK